MKRTDFKTVTWKKSLPVGVLGWSLLSFCLTGTMPLKAADNFRAEITQQNSQITGIVVDGNGEPLIGVNVTVKNTTNGSITDFSGKFLLNERKAVTLVVSYVGYKTQNIQAKPGVPVRVVLEEDSQVLDEVVAIGYGKVKRRDVTGSVVSVGNSELTAIPVASPVEAMQGKLAGVRVTTPEGSPDAEVVIRVRGGGSITSDNTPLFIVDGFPVNSISDIPATDIESIDVLKDASSTAIYGSRGSNGIVLVTTKSGKAGKVTVNYNIYAGLKKAATKVDVLGTEDYLRFQYENFALENKLSNFTSLLGSWNQLGTLAQEVPTTDWQEEVYGRTGNTFNHNLSISGGTEKLRFNFGYNHMNEKAILETSRFKRDNLSLKVNFEPNKKTKLEFAARYARTQVFGDGQSDVIPTSDATPAGSFSRIRHAIVQTPLTLNAIGSNFLWNDNDIDSGLEDPIVALNDNYKERTRQNFNMNGAFSWNITKNLSFRTDLGLDIYENELDYFYGSTTYESQNNAQAAYKNLPLINETQVIRRTFRNTNTLNYDFDELLGKGHNLNVMVGEENVVKKENTVTARVEGFPDFYDANMAFNLSAQGVPTRYQRYYYEDDKMVSFFGRANYDYKGRYLLSATFRADGSSKFSRGNRWGYFPSVALGWRILEESWMESTRNWLSNLKLRASYGVSGNNNIPSGQTSKVYSITQQSWLNIANSWLSAGTALNNPNLKWETTHSVNVGLDFGLFNNALSGSVEVYKNRVKDLLMQMQITGSGYNTQYQNVGETENSGFELTLNYNAINKKNFGLDLGFTLGHNVNKVVSLGGMDYYTKDSYWASTEVGADYLIKPDEPVGTIYGFVTEGRYEVGDFTGYDGNKWILKEGQPDNSSYVGTLRPGNLKLKDQDGDGMITDADKTIIGNANAWAVGGFTLNARLYGFDLGANFNYSLGNDIYNADKIDQTSTRGGEWRNLNSIMASGNRWTNIDSSTSKIVNDPSTLAKLNATTTMWAPYIQKAIIHSWAVEDGSFLRLSNVTLGYTLPKDLTRKFFIENLRLYMTASNLFCITGYSGADPEVDCRRNLLVCPGVDFSAYPKNRQYIVGINLTF